jgi:hypothetical protein
MDRVHLLITYSAIPVSIFILYYACLSKWVIVIYLVALEAVTRDAIKLLAERTPIHSRAGKLPVKFAHTVRVLHTSAYLKIPRTAILSNPFRTSPQGTARNTATLCFGELYITSILCLAAEFLQHCSKTSNRRGRCLELS